MCLWRSSFLRAGEALSAVSTLVVACRACQWWSELSGEAHACKAWCERTLWRISGYPAQEPGRQFLNEVLKARQAGAVLRAHLPQHCCCGAVWRLRELVAGCCMRPCLISSGELYLGG